MARPNSTLSSQVTASGPRPGAVLAALHDLQERHGYLPEDGLRAAAKGLGVPLGQVFSVAAFYDGFRLEPRGRCLVEVCQGTACHVRGADGVAKAFQDETGAPVGGSSEDMAYSVETVRCIGCCSLAPVARIDGQVFARLTPKKARSLVRREAPQ